MSIELPVEYTEINGKKWLYSIRTFTIQCAYCLYQQMLEPIREDGNKPNHLVIGLISRDESHAKGCPQE